jgi:hypothetical protein
MIHSLFPYGTKQLEVVHLISSHSLMIHLKQQTDLFNETTDAITPTILLNVWFLFVKG